MTFEEGLDRLKDTFHNYIKSEVLSKVKNDDLGKQKSKLKVNRKSSFH